MFEPKNSPTLLSRRSVLKRLGLTGAAVIGGSSLLAACGGDNEDDPGRAGDGSTSAAPTSWDEVVEAAREEGRVALYLSQVGVAEILKKPFEDKYGIELIFLRESSTNIETKVDAEKSADADGADVVLSTNPLWFDKNSSSFLPIIGPAKSPYEGTEFLKDNWVMPYINPLGLTFNTQLSEVPVKGYEDLLSPSFRGRIGGLRQVSPTVTFLLKFLEDTYGEEYLRKLAAQEVVFAPSQAVVGQSVAAGETWAGYCVTEINIAQLKESGAPVEFVLPSSTAGSACGIAALDWSKRPNSARVLLDFTMSTEGLTALVEAGVGAFPNISGIPGAPTGSVKPSPILDYTPDQVAAMAKRYDEILGM